MKKPWSGYDQCCFDKLHLENQKQISQVRNDIDIEILKHWALEALMSLVFSNQKNKIHEKGETDCCSNLKISISIWND